MKLDRRNEPKTFTDYRPLSRGSLIRGEDRETWRLWMLIISFGGIVVSSIIAAAVGS